MKDKLMLAELAASEYDRTEFWIPLQITNPSTFMKTTIREIFRRAEKFDISTEASALSETRYLSTVSDQLGIGLRLPFPVTWLEDRVDDMTKIGFLMGEMPGGLYSVHFVQLEDVVKMSPLVFFTRISDGHLECGPINGYPKNVELFAEYKTRSPDHFLNEMIHHPLRLINLISDTHQTVLSERSENTGRFYRKGKFRPYFSHRTVNIVPDAPERVAHSEGQGSPHRRHKVRGFYRKNPKTGLRDVFVEAHERGDARLGWIHHDYDVHREDENAGR